LLERRGCSAGDKMRETKTSSSTAGSSKLRGSSTLTCKNLGGLYAPILERRGALRKNN